MLCKQKIGEYIQIQGGFAFKSSTYQESGIPIIRISNITDRGIILDNVCVSNEIMEQTKNYLAEIDDSLIAMSGATTGKMGLIKAENLPALINQRVGRFVYIKPSDKKYFYQLSLSNEFQRQVEINAMGGAQPNISPQKIENIDLYIETDKNKQAEIANILSTCDEVIEKTEETIEKYKQIKAGMMQDLFTRGLDTNGKLRPTYAQTPDLYKYSEELDRYIPKDWDIKKLNEIGNIVTGSTPSTQNLSYYGDEYMFVSPADIDEDRYIKTTLKNLSLKGFNISRKIPANSVCVVCIGSTIGKEAISEKECTTNQQINTIIPFNSNFSLYYYYSTCLYLKKQFDANVGLQAVPIVNKSNFEEFYIPEPKDEKEVVKIQSIVNQFDEKIEKEEQYLNKYKQIKQGLMKRLLTPPADAEIVEE